MSKRFGHFATAVSNAIASPYAFLLGVLGILLWAVSGFWLGFSDTWHLLINTPTTIITFLTVFLLQHRGKRDTEATHLKLDELITQLAGPRDELAGIEKREDEC